MQKENKIDLKNDFEFITNFIKQNDNLFLDNIDKELLQILKLAEKKALQVQKDYNDLNYLFNEIAGKALETL